MPAGRHWPFYVAVAAGLVATAGAVAWKPGVALPLGSTVFFATYLALTVSFLPKMTAAYLRANAASSDLPVLVIFAVTFAAVASAVVALFVLLNTERLPSLPEIVLTLLAVPLGWMTIHMMAAIHYAHLYWQPQPATPDEDDMLGGLDFPGTNAPRGVDFAYFSFVIGMTAQTSDVAITTHLMRATNLVHAIVSFFFNTVLVAAAVNAAVALGN
ncbi:DUF1345 domain-containing protein [Mesorhizobium sp. CAU 1741]|uniref:DUF1345 domain-containing protein n=1 Tax=Mesorhizobium sp. CAU 1741 TaxID=3140366 RepID=UPI00325BF897